MYKICFFVPEGQKEKVKNAMFLAGAGKIGFYNSCAFETLGTGQFQPLAGSNPFFGKENNVEKVSEYKVEMVCDDAFISDAINTLKANHPYETPAYEVFKLENF